MRSTVVLGGGISGLALTYQLYRRGVDVVLIEASDRLGGVIRSQTCDGFLIEHGPNSTLVKPALTELIEDLGLTADCLFPQENAQHRFLVGGAPPGLRPVPQRLTGAITSPILSIRGKLRLLLEPFVARCPNDDDSVHDFISHRLGSDVADEIVAPMLGGIWAADIARLSCRTALPALWQMEQHSGSLCFSALRRYASKHSSHNKLRPRIMTFKTGVSAIIDQLARRIPAERVLLNTKAESVSLSDQSVSIACSGANGSVTIEAARCISELPARQTARLLRDIDPDLSAQVQAIPYAPLGVLHLACDGSAARHALNGFGFLVPPRMGLATLGAIFSSSLFAGRAPPGKHLITCFAGGARCPELAAVDSGPVQERVIAEVSQLLGLSIRPRILNATTWSAAIPNYPLGHHLTQRLIDEFNSSHERFQVFGNWLRGISVGDRIEQARARAQAW